ncbi:MAG: two pore domain potassium channel family protein [Deltaproteobacteria bacterium]|nr:MAG: two pore domain potassium channel family protein [Deltaproteobacteria bacterium]
MDPIRTRLKFYLITLLGVMAVGVFGFMLLEQKSFIDALYFMIVTIATVGYGDIHPVTPLGKLFVILLILSGVGTFLGVIANATEIMLSRREKQVRLEKLNMVIGAFFSEVGTKLIRLSVDYDPDFDEVRKGLIITEKWTHQKFVEVSAHLRQAPYRVDAEKVNWNQLADFLIGKRDFLVRLLENPILLEHESFTDLLRAVFHLVEELSSREDFQTLPSTDTAHLGGDIKRVYFLLVRQWLDYMEHLKNSYPYLFSLAMRTNPFDRKASVLVR